MPLKAKIDSIDDVPEAVREYYTPAEEGGYMLDAEGVVSKDQHNEFVNNNKALFAKNKQYETQIAETQAQAEALRQQLEQTQQGGKKKDSDYATRIEALEQRYKEAEAEKAKAIQQARDGQKRDVLKTALAGAGVNPKALDDAVQLAAPEWGYDEEGQLLRQQEGVPVLSSENAGKNQSLKEYTAELSQAKPWLFTPSRGDGAEAKGQTVDGVLTVRGSELSGIELAKYGDLERQGKAKII